MGAERLGAGVPKSVSEALGLYRDRLHPEGTPAGMHGWWDIFDEDSARTAVTDMTVQLDRTGWPVLEAMFSRDAMMKRLHDGDLGLMKRRNFGVFFARAEALLLMDAGPSDALESRLFVCPEQPGRDFTATTPTRSTPGFAPRRPGIDATHSFAALCAVDLAEDGTSATESRRSLVPHRRLLSPSLRGKRWCRRHRPCRSS